MPRIFPARGIVTKEGWQRFCSGDNFKPMKAVGILAVLLAATSLGGQTNEIFPVLRADGESYTNARITHLTPASAVIVYDGGSVQIALRNLPPELQRKFGYDPANVTQYLADKQEQEIAARAACRTASGRLRESHRVTGGHQSAGSDLVGQWLCRIHQMYCPDQGGNPGGLRQSFAGFDRGFYFAIESTAPRCPRL